MNPEIEITKVARHGVVMDFTEASGNRVHVRVFRHGPGMIAGVPVELPQDLAVEEVASLLRECAGLVDGEAYYTRAGEPVAEVAPAAVGDGWPLLAVDEEAGEGARAPADPLPTMANDGQPLPTPPAASRPVLFFDVDGVLNSQVGALDGGKLDLLAWIVTSTGCRAVCISSWRGVADQMLRLRAECARRGMEVEQTPVLQSLSLGGVIRDEGRVSEILEWIHDHGRDGRWDLMGEWCILDDEAGHYAGTAIEGRLEQTEFATGLTHEIALRVVRRLLGLPDAVSPDPALASAATEGGAA